MIRIYITMPSGCELPDGKATLDIYDPLMSLTREEVRDILKRAFTELNADVFAGVRFEDECPQCGEPGYEMKPGAIHRMCVNPKCLSNMPEDE